MSGNIDQTRSKWVFLERSRWPKHICQIKFSKISLREKSMGEQKFFPYGAAPAIFFKIATDTLLDVLINLAEEHPGCIEV